jgi:hypothetical protein
LGKITAKEGHFRGCRNFGQIFVQYAQFFWGGGHCFNRKSCRNFPRAESETLKKVSYIKEFQRLVICRSQNLKNLSFCSKAPNAADFIEQSCQRITKKRLTKQSR